MTFMYNCVLAEHLSEEEEAWLKKAIRLVPRLEERYDGEAEMIETHVNRGAWYASGEGGDFAEIAYMICRMFLRKFRPDDVIAFHWIDDDRHGYYGGAVAVSLTDETWILLDTWAEARREGVPATHTEHQVAELRERIKEKIREKEGGYAAGLRQALAFMHEVKLI